MHLVFYAGVAVTLVGLLGVLRFIQRVRQLKDAKSDDPSIQAQFRSLVLLNMGAVGVAFFGLAIALVGLILS